MPNTWDDRAFLSALKHRCDNLKDSAEGLPGQMTEDMADIARRTVKRLTGATAASIESQAGKGEAELSADNAFLEFGTSKTLAQPFVRPARAEVITRYQSGRYKPHT